MTGATESSFVFLNHHYKFPESVHISQDPKELYKSTKKYKVLWSHHSYDQPIYLNFDHKKIDLIVCPSDWLKKQFVKYHKVPENKLKVIPNGASDIFTYSNKKSKTLIHTSVPYKGAILLPTIFKQVLKKHPDAKLKVFSSMKLYGIEADSYKNLYEELKSLPNVEWSHPVDHDELVDHYQDAAFFIHPNIWEETFCVSLAEAMRCGCYPIITDIGALPEVSNKMASIVSIDGIRKNTGYEVSNEFLNTYINEVVNLLDRFDKEKDTYYNITKQLSDFACEKYDWKKIAHIWKKTLEELMSSELKIIDAKEAVREDKDYLKQALDNVLKWEESDKELAQGRSNFQIEKFFLLEQHTIPSAYQATLKNRRILAEGYMQKLIEMKQKVREFEYKWNGKDKTQPVKWEFTSGGPASGGSVKLCWYDLDEIELTNYLKSSELEIRDRIQQMHFFDSILEKLIEKNGGPITRQQFEEEDHIYWERRFAEQSFDEMISRITGISIGNLHSMRRGTAPDVVSNGVNVIKNGYAPMGMALNPETALQFAQSLQDKVVQGMEEITGQKFGILPEQESSAESQKQLNSTESFFNSNSGINYYKEE